MTKPESVHDGLHTRLAGLAGVLAGTGSGIAAIIGALGVATWLIVGAVSAEGYDEHWHWILHSTGAGVALIMVFVIQYTNHRQAKAILLKLDELLRADAEARDAIIGVEKKSIGKQERLEQQMHAHTEKE
ncbi:MAG TPA: low affinity iron permease family protein [Candidatus Limnocylindrales bacterium]|nr:low affinity iron permease family protein [Candidatus Limnocylindrales bacterium]